MLAATAAENDVAQRALEELNREDAVYLFSALVELETLPLPTHNGRRAEIQFYMDYFSESERVACGEAEQQRALQLMYAERGLSTVDALHVACAIEAGASELVTAEGITKPLTNVTVAGIGLAVRTIRVAG